MDKNTQKPPDHQSSQTDEQSQTAVPYVSPPPLDQSSQKLFKSPLVNGALVAVVILLCGYMSYNYMGHQLTRLSSASVEVSVSPTPSITPTVTIDQTNSYPSTP